jgi:hypothetical protein
MSDLENHRDLLHEKILDLDLVGEEYKGDEKAIEFIQGNYAEAHRLIDAWWKAYKDWEKDDKFNVAVQDDRMTMRSYGSDFAYQVSKTKPVGIGDRRFYDSERKVLDPAMHKASYAAMNLPAHKRGIDTSAYAEPSNFVNRKAKYDAGLHDLSVKLVVKGQDLKANCHHQAETTPHFCFLPLSQGKDQFVLYKLMRYAKNLRAELPDLDTLVRGYRSRMTRVKLASDYDMGTGYSAVPTPDRDDGLNYKVTYGLGSTIKKRGLKVPLVTNKARLQARQEMYFQHRADIVKFGGNEVVIAMREHAGEFPVYAVYDNGILRCFDIEAGQKKLNGKTISAVGVASWEN